MKKRKKKIKGKIIFLLIVASGVLSYIYSREVYVFYNKIYYEKIRGETLEERIKYAYGLLEKKEHEKLRKYVQNLSILYPDNSEIKKIEGLNLIYSGEKVTGVDKVLDAVKGRKIPRDILEDTIATLFEQGAYEDVISVLRKNDPGENSNILFYYGVSLYNTGRYDESVRRLKESINEGRTDYSLYLYLGKAHMKLGKYRDAVSYLEKAKRMKSWDMTVNKWLADAYRRLGRYEDAERLLRNQ